MSARPAPASITATERWTVHVLVAGVGCVAALLLRAPLAVVLVAPSALLVGAALAWRPGAPPGVGLEVADGRVQAGDATTGTVRVTSDVRRAVEVIVSSSGPVDVAGPTRTLATVGPDDPLVLDLTLTTVRWGLVSLGPVTVRWWSPGGLVGARSDDADTASLHVLPRTPDARVLVRPRATHTAHGAQRSDAAAEGTEFAEVRPFAPGDRARDVSPAVSARRGAPWVVRRHPERRTDVVLLLDAYDPHELGHVLHAARALAAGHLRTRDRVGVATMTGVLRVLAPGDGARHEHRIAVALLEAQLDHSWVRPAVEGLPPRLLPPGALVVGITPGTDPRLADTAIALRRRGRDVAVLVVAPRDPATDPVGHAADRIVALERRTARDRLQAAGVPAVTWDPANPVDAAVAALAPWRRAVRR